MPIYEFYCQRCNTVYKFLSKRINTETTPNCPNCRNVRLRRQMSLFAAVSGRKEDGPAADVPFDEAKMEKAMAMLAREAGGMNEDDPRQAASLMRKLSDATGLRMGEGMEEALNRLERGEDPEKIEQEMGDLLSGEEPFALEDKGKKARQSAPKVDETLYEL